MKNNGKVALYQEKFNALEKQMGEHDEKIHVIFDTIRDLLESNESKTPRIGFRAHNG